MKKKLLCFVTCAVIATALRAEPMVRFARDEGPINVFSGAQTNVMLGVKPEATGRARVTWRLAANNRTLDRGESAVTVSAGEWVETRIPLRVPEVKPGVIVPTALTVDIAMDDGAPQANTSAPVYVFAEDPFHGLRNWLEKMPLCVFDPEGETTKRLDQAEVDYVAQDNMDALPETAKGLLLVGEGVSFRECRGLWALLTAIAEKGVPVLCLAPSTGEMDLSPVLAAGGQRRMATRVELRGSDMIRDLDKRLDASACVGRGETARGFVLRGERGPILAEVEEGTDGWKWLEFGFGKAQTKLVVCSFPVIENWSGNPAPRVLLLRMLEHIASTPDTGKKIRE